jgi:hypothetical protein
MEYTVKFVEDHVISTYGREGPQDVPNASALMNDMAQQGWQLHSFSPGTNAQTYGGLFIVFRRG